tara:strand:+ start:520 stop:1275 length:756 start_codon:yes stop_codon:yes gene_type:complete
MLKRFLKKILQILGYKISKIENNDTLKIVGVNDEVKKIILKSSTFSMTGKLRMYVLSEAIKNIRNNSIKGEFVECGVWRGGNLILMNELNKIYKLKKKIYGFDTFDGMSEPTEFDKDPYDISAKKRLENSIKSETEENVHCFSPIEEVRKNISDNSSLENIILVKGMVEKTLLNNDNIPEQISLLRLDTDFYESTKIELEILFPKLVSGGILILDDYGYWSGARKAIDEYFKNTNYWLHYVDPSCRYLIKE